MWSLGCAAVIIGPGPYSQTSRFWPSEEKAAAAAANQDRLLSRRLMFSAFLAARVLWHSAIFFAELGVCVKFVSYGFVDSVCGLGACSRKPSAALSLFSTSP